MECNTCKKHYSQSGRCMENKSNCLLYEEEPRGKMIKTTFTFQMRQDAETPIIRSNEKIIFEDKGNSFEATINKVNWINMKEMTCNVDCEYHEHEKPYCEKKKMFRVMN